MRFLIVEGDRALGEALAADLRQRGCGADWIQNGSQADSILRITKFDAIVLDLGLPEDDGTVWLSRWRGHGVTLPILILTARDAVEQRIAGLDGGADEYLIKPFGVDELAAHLCALVRRAAGRAQPVCRQGALAYDFNRKQVSWRRRNVELTHRELVLLEALLTNPQRVLSRAHLQEQLYDGTSEEPESNTLEVYVHRLRRKIDPSIVRTVRGVGYALGSCEPTA